MFWTVSNRVQIIEDYKTGELRFNQTIELPYSQHEADCENQMGVINRWNERMKEAAKTFADTPYEHAEAKICYEYELRELDHLIRHQHISGASRIHYGQECETCDKIDAANVKHYHDYEPLYTARHTDNDLTVTMRDYIRCTKCDFVSYTVNA
jgi:hypothetical protein